MREQLIELLNRVSWDAGKHIAKPLERINLQQFARTHEASENRHCFAAPVTAQKRPVVGLPPARPRSGRSVRVGADGQIAQFSR